MSYYTQSGSRRSDRIAGNPPNPNNDNLNPPQNNAAQTTFSPFNDTQAAADGVSYGSSHNSIDHNLQPTQDNIAFLQQPSQASTDSRSSTPVSLRGRQIQKNLAQLASTTKKQPPTSTYQPQRSNHPSEEFYLRGPPKSTQHHGPASNNYNVHFQQQQQQRSFQPQPTNTMSTPFQQPNPAFSTPFQPPHQPWPQQFNTPAQQHQQPPPPVVKPQQLPDNINFNFAQPPSNQQRFQSIELRLSQIERDHQESHQRLLEQMTQNHNMIMKILQQQAHQQAIPTTASKHQHSVTFANDDLLNLHPLQMNTTDQPSVHPPASSNHPSVPTAAAPSAPPPPPPAVDPTPTPPIVDLTHESDAASHITTDSASHPPSLPSDSVPVPPVTSSFSHHSATTTASQQPIIVKVEGKKDTRLNFKPFKSKKDDYESWKASCLSKVHTSGMYPTATFEDSDENTIKFNSNMSSNESRLIVQQTIDCLDEPANFTTGENILQIKAFSLWETLDAFYGVNSVKRKEDDDYSDLTDSWSKFTRRKTETINDYTIRYRKLVQSIREQPHAPLTITHYNEVLTYLREMQEPAIAENITVDFSKYKKEWCTGKTIMEVQLKAKQYIKQANNAVPRYRQLSIENSLTNKSSSNHDSSKQPDSSKQTTKPPNDSNKGRTNNGERNQTKGFDYDELESNLKKANDKIAYLEKCYSSNSERFSKKEFKSACSKANCWEEWKQIAEKHNIQFREGESRARRVASTGPSQEWLTAVQNQIISGVVTKLNGNNADSDNAGNKSVSFDANLPKANDAKVDSGDNSKDAVTKYLQKLIPQSAIEQLSFKSHSQSSPQSCSIPSPTPSIFQDTQQSPSSVLEPMTNQPSLKSSTPATEATPRSQIEQNNSKDIHQLNTYILSHCKYNRSSDHQHQAQSSSTVLKAIPDSGATDTMSGNKSLFEEITYYDTTTSQPQPTVILGDDTTQHPILGYGWLNYIMNGKRIRQVGYYIPALGDVTLISILNHMKYKGNYFHAEDNIATLAYPSFTVQLRTSPELETDIHPSAHSTAPFDYDESIATTCLPSNAKATLRMISSSQAPYLDTTSVPDSITETIQIMKLTDKASIPTRGTPGSIGYDVKAAYPTLIQPGEIGKIGTGLSTSFSTNMYLRIAPRSSLALQHITVEGGVVDSDFRGEIKVLLKNNSNAPFQITPGQKIAQFIFEKASTPLIEVTKTLSTTTRGSGGFGSTDTKLKSPNEDNNIRPHTKAKRSFLHDSFRIDYNTVVIMNYSNPFRPIARRLKVPYHPSEALQVLNPATGQVTTPEELIPTDMDDLSPTTTLKSHILSDKPSKPSIILEMDVNPQDSSTLQVDNVNNTATLQYADDKESDVNTSEFQPSPPLPLEDHEDDAISIIEEEPSDDESIHHLQNRATTSDNDTTIPSQDIIETEISTLEDAAKDLSSILDTSSSTPRLRPVDKVNKSMPKILTMSQDALKRSIGFLNPTTLQRNINKLGTQSVRIQNLPQNPSIDPGEVASISSNRKSKQTPTPARHYGDIWHMDIGYGPCTSIGGMKYTLLLIDKYSRYKFVYGLTNLTSSLLDAMKKFLTECGTTPSLIRTDFDNKFLGGAISELLIDKQITVEAAPPYRQHQNGLVERHWQTIVNMARNWLTSSYLPSSYWYFAIKRACEVTNLLPVKKGSTYTTPFQLVYNQKPDYRNLIPMFCLAYIKQPRMEGQAKNSWISKTLKCVLVGKCNRSDSLLFYHPPSKQILSCADGFRLDTHTPAGPHFNQYYEGDFIFNLKSDLEQPVHQPPAYEENSTAWLKLPEFDNYQQVKILSIPIDDETDTYVVQHIDSGDIHEALQFEIKDHNPDANPTETTTINDYHFPHLPWIQHDAKATMYLPQIMSKPKRGYLQYDDTTDKWSFIPGMTKKNEKIDLPGFIETVDSLISNKKLFKGWVNANKVISARQVRVTSNFLSRLICNRKVSAKNLHDLSAPTLLKHHKLHPEDRAIWDQAYQEEYQGLMDIDTWEIISEEKYNAMKNVLGNLLPTMAITTIKYDGKGNPDRAKYRIVALGNLDPHNWSKPDCFAPVLSQMELRFLTSLAVRNRCIPKTGDVSQAFCQSYLPNDEHYVLRPPPGCPITPPNSYLKLKKTLYGLKRSPRHFYQLAVKHLKAIGLEQHPYSPCIFYGTLIEGEPPIYLGLYVDDFIYFSESRAVEEKFETSFSSTMPMTFSDEIDYFLGINFTCKRHHDGHVSIKLDQEAFVDTIVEQSGLAGPAVNEPRTPYRSGLPVDSIPIEEYDQDQQNKLTHLLQVLVGNLNWLAISTRPDIAPITNMLAKYMSKASKGHVEQAKRVIKYLKGTKHKGILFTSKDRSNLTSYVKFPINPSKVTALCDANWGPQDQSKPNPDNPQELDLFKSRSMSGYLLWLGGPLHWTSKRQSITARSSAEAEIYATDECTKQLIHLSYIIEGLNLIEAIMKPPTTIYNDNNACVCWSKTTTTKGLRHIQMRENAIREAVETDFISVQHIEGKINLSDMFTKEDKDTEHFLTIRDFILSDSVDDYDSIETKIDNHTSKEESNSSNKDKTEIHDNAEEEEKQSAEKVSEENEKDIKDFEVQKLTPQNNNIENNTEDSGKMSTIESPSKTLLS